MWCNPVANSHQVFGEQGNRSEDQICRNKVSNSVACSTKSTGTAVQKNEERYQSLDREDVAIEWDAVININEGKVAEHHLWWLKAGRLAGKTACTAARVFKTLADRRCTGASKQAAATPAYRCKKCRRVIALQENVLDHVPGEGETSFDWHKRRGGNPISRTGDNVCSIFVEPLRWMKTVEEGGLEGKLMCAHCEGRLGYFNWSGIQCSCGSWMTPAFQLHKSRVDISTI